MSTCRRPILVFRNVTTEPSTSYDTSVWNVSFALQAGDLLLLRRDPEFERLPLADAGEGLIAPLEGEVCFLDHNWQMLSADAPATYRGQIGRVFEQETWISDMDLDKNIILAQLHHTKHKEEELLNKACELAQLFGLPGLPLGRPTTIRRQDLRKCGCIRAFLGQPVLLLLENPTRGVYTDIIEPLVEMIQSARKRGTAVLWMTSDAEVWSDEGLRPTQRGEMFGSHLQFVSV